MLEDCRCAVRFLRAQADTLGIAADRIGVIGGSAGGHLAAMLGLPESAETPTTKLYPGYSGRVQAIVDLYGPVDLLTMGWDLTKLFGGTIDGSPQDYIAASPNCLLTGDYPPTLILHGTGDKTVPVAQSRSFAEALARVGVEHALLIVEGAPHSFHLQPEQADLRPVVLTFFDRHLRPAAH